jgi:hypothetical protein
MSFDLIARAGPCGRVSLAPAARIPPQVAVPLGMTTQLHVEDR